MPTHFVRNTMKKKKPSCLLVRVQNGTILRRTIWQNLWKAKMLLILCPNNKIYRNLSHRKCGYTSIHLKLCMCNVIHHTLLVVAKLGTAHMPMNKGPVKYPIAHPFDRKRCTLKLMRGLFKDWYLRFYKIYDKNKKQII